jgi:transcriptional regulator with XRE-family HTH domain
MSGQTEATRADPAEKIARLVQERGWNQEDLARNAGLNRQTVRQILQPSGDRRLRNATISACARALGLSVSQLHMLPLEQLLQWTRSHEIASEEENKRRLYEQATQPELIAWIERNPERAGQLSALEIDELLSLQGTGGHLTGYGVERFVEYIERRRRLRQQIDVITGTEYLDVLEKIVGLMYEKVQPYRDRS